MIYKRGMTIDCDCEETANIIADLVDRAGHDATRKAREYMEKQAKEISYLQRKCDRLEAKHWGEEE